MVGVKTKISPNGIIQQDTIFDNDSMGLQNQIYQAILDTKEKQIRDALIELGWTPPKEDKGD